jgi:prevent-host-death family protein
MTNIHQAKTHFSKLIERAAAGEEIVIGKAGKPVARLVPYEKAPPLRKAGSMKGKIRIAHDFADLPADVLEAFKASCRESSTGHSHSVVVALR